MSSGGETLSSVLVYDGTEGALYLEAVQEAVKVAEGWRVTSFDDPEAALEEIDERTNALIMVLDMQTLWMTLEGNQSSNSTSSLSPPIRMVEASNDLGIPRATLSPLAIGNLWVRKQGRDIALPNTQPPEIVPKLTAWLLGLSGVETLQVPAEAEGEEAAVSEDVLFGDRHEEIKEDVPQKEFFTPTGAIIFGGNRKLGLGIWVAKLGPGSSFTYSEAAAALGSKGIDHSLIRLCESGLVVRDLTKNGRSYYIQPSAWWDVFLAAETAVEEDQKLAEDQNV